MDILDIIDIIINNSVAVGMLIYMCIYNSKQIKSLTDAINKLTELIKLLKADVDNLRRH